MAPFLLVSDAAATLLEQERDGNLDVGEQEPAAGHALMHSLLLTPSGAGTVRARCR